MNPAKLLVFFLCALHVRAPARSGQCWPIISAGKRRRSTSFTHVFQLYEGFLLRERARLIVLASRRAETEELVS